MNIEDVLHQLETITNAIKTNNQIKKLLIPTEFYFNEAGNVESDLITLINRCSRLESLNIDLFNLRSEENEQQLKRLREIANSRQFCEI